MGGLILIALANALMRDLVIDYCFPMPHPEYLAK